MFCETCVHLRCPTFQHEHSWVGELHPLPHKTHLKLGRKSEPHPHTIRSQPESCMNLSRRQNCRNSKPPLGPSLRFICVDQLTTVGSGMRLAPTDSNLTLRWRFSSPEGRLGSDCSQNASGLLPGGEGAHGALFQKIDVGHVIQPRGIPSHLIHCHKVAPQDSRRVCSNGHFTVFEHLHGHPPTRDATADSVLMKLAPMAIIALPSNVQTVIKTLLTSLLRLLPPCYGQAFVLGAERQVASGDGG